MMNPLTRRVCTYTAEKARLLSRHDELVTRKMQAHHPGQRIKKPIIFGLLIGLITLAAASGAPSSKPAPGAGNVGLSGVRFDGLGKVMMHVGQPCTSQIMFDFRRDHSKNSVWLSARVRETTLLTQAAQRRQRVHIWGNWQRGKEKDCRYIHVTKVETAPARFLFF